MAKNNELLEKVADYYSRVLNVAAVRTSILEKKAMKNAFNEFLALFYIATVFLSNRLFPQNEELSYRINNIWEKDRERDQKKGGATVV